MRVIGVSEDGVVADDAEDDRPGYGHRHPVEVNTCDSVTCVGAKIGYARNCSTKSVLGGLSPCILVRTDH